MPEDDTTAELCERLAHFDPSTRMRAAIELQDTGGYSELTLPILIGDMPAVDDELLDEWQWAMASLGVAGLTALADAACDTSSPYEQRLLAASTLGTQFFEHIDSVEERLTSLLDEESDIGCWAAAILAKEGSLVHSRDAFLRALSSDNSSLIVEAIQGMHSFQPADHAEAAKVKSAILPALTHADDDVRGRCSMFVSIDLDEQDLKSLDLGNDERLDAVVKVLARMSPPPLASRDLLFRALLSEDY